MHAKWNRGVALLALMLAHAPTLTTADAQDGLSTDSGDAIPSAETLAGHSFDTRDADPALVSGLSSLISGLTSGLTSSILTAVGTALSPTQQNGASLWGTRANPSLPQYKTGGGTVVKSGSTPWGNINVFNTNPYKGQPSTGVTRSYTLKVAPCNVSPDGVQTTGVLCINGQFPGPLIEANYGDTISVTVQNGLTDEGTSMHWHGFLQTNTNNMDGVPGVTQCPIPPGGSMTYTFRAELYGTSWYHTHYSAQYAGGAVGPIVIYGPADKSYDEDLGPIMLQEWYRKDYKSYVQGFMNPLQKGGPALPLASSNLINGKMRYPCKSSKAPCQTADYSMLNFTSGQNHRLRLVNTGAAAIQKFAIDGHVMQVIANDYMPVQPYNVSMIALGVGQRADVIVYGSGKPTDVVWMRSNIVACSLNDGGLTEALGIIYYEKANPTAIPTGPANSGPAASTSLMSCSNDPLTNTIPSYPLAVTANPYTFTVNINLQSNGTNMLFYMGNQSFMVDYNDPVLAGNWWNPLTVFQPRRNIFNLNNADSTRVILYNYDDAPHPIHLHGHNAQILNVGFGKWDGSIIRSTNPARRDVFVMPPGSTGTPSYLVLQWDQDNPGIWPLHCHFAWHSSMGLLLNVVEKPMSLVVNQKIWMSSISSQCNAWNSWLKKFGVLTTAIDSGLKKRTGVDDLGRLRREIFPGSGFASYGENDTGTSTEAMVARWLQDTNQTAEDAYSSYMGGSAAGDNKVTGVSNGPVGIHDGHQYSGEVPSAGTAPQAQQLGGDVAGVAHSAQAQQFANDAAAAGASAEPGVANNFQSLYDKYGVSRSTQPPAATQVGAPNANAMFSSPASTAGGYVNNAAGVTQGYASGAANENALYPGPASAAAAYATAEASSGQGYGSGAVSPGQGHEMEKGSWGGTLKGGSS